MQRLQSFTIKNINQIELFTYKDTIVIAFLVQYEAIFHSIVILIVKDCNFAFFFIFHLVQDEIHCHLWTNRSILKSRDFY